MWRKYGTYIWLGIGILASWVHFKDFLMAIRHWLFIAGEIEIIWSAVFLYIDLKDYRFRPLAIPKKSWITFLLSQLITWTLFFLFFSKKLFMMAYFVEIGMLIFLLVYDIIASLLRKLFRKLFR